MTDLSLSRFAAEYAAHRATEGRGHSGRDLLELPYLTHGPLARQWAVRARSHDAFCALVMRPHAARLGRPLHLLDLGAGNGWLSYRVALEGHSATALDIRDDRVDGLGAADPYLARVPGRIQRIKASFDSIPLDPGTIDIAIFNASIHYAVDLERTIVEAARTVRPGGLLAILDSPFYSSDRDGAAMVEEKRRGASAQFGSRADVLLGLPFIEYLTPASLELASSEVGLRWERQRVRYPLWYETRPLVAALRGRRRPSRFDLWVAERP